MSLSELCWNDASTLSAMIQGRVVSPVEVTAAHLERIASMNKTVSAYLHVCWDSALAEARQAEVEISAGQHRGPLHGVPIAYKDIFNVSGLPTTGHSRILADYVARTDSAVAAALRRAGTVTLGKLNTTEFAAGGMEFLGFARNPWNLHHSPGNSSSGAGVALAAAMTPLAIGSDTGGSTRIPASFCGTLGLKPTTGLVSTDGMLPISSEMDCVGLMARTASDLWLLLQSLADATSRRLSPADRALDLNAPLDGLTFGIPRTYFFDAIDPGIAASLHRAIDTLRQLGATPHHVDLPHAEFSLAAHWCTSYSEAYPRFQRLFIARRGDFGSIFVRKLSTWAFLTADELASGWRLRKIIKKEMEDALERVHFLLTPTTPTVAPLANNFAATHQDTSRFTRAVSLTRLPALAVPCGMTPDCLPVSIQLIGREWDEGLLIRVANAFQQAVGTLPYPRSPRTLHGLAGTTIPYTSTNRIERGIESDWLKRYSELMGLSYLTDEDYPPMAIQLSPVKEQLIKSRRIVKVPSDIWSTVSA